LKGTSGEPWKPRKSRKKRSPGNPNTVRNKKWKKLPLFQGPGTKEKRIPEGLTKKRKGIKIKSGTVQRINLFKPGRNRERKAKKKKNGVIGGETSGEYSKKSCQ